MNGSKVAWFLIAATLAAVAGAGCGSGRLEGGRPDAQQRQDAGAPEVAARDAAADARTCPEGKPAPDAAACYTCDPLPAGSDAGCGGPIPALWGFDGGPTPEGRRYPVGCGVALPVENPFYPGGPQFCSCTTLLQIDGSPRWLCPI